MKRLITITLAAAFAIAGFAAPTAAHTGSDPADNHVWIHDVTPGWLEYNPDQYRWKDWFNGWIDVKCGTSGQEFRIDFYSNANYTGKKVRVCHDTTGPNGASTFCEVPMGGIAKWGGVDACIKGGLFATGWGTANDKVTSFKVQSLPGTSCIRVFEHKDRKGRWFTTKQSQPNLANRYFPNTSMSFNDRISSLKKKTGTACNNTFGSN